MTSTTSTKRRIRTEDQRTKANEYQRRYRKENPTRVKAWRRAYILKAADKLRAAMAETEGGADRGGGN